MRKKYFGKCSCCKNEKQLTKNKKETGRICEACYVNNFQPKKICFDCKEKRQVHKNTSDGPCCIRCYKKAYEQPKYKCYKCGCNSISNKTVGNDHMCLKCYDKFLKPNVICSICKKTRVAKKYINYNPICGTCYKDYAPKTICCECGETTVISKRDKNGSICKTCYNKRHYPLNRCSNCSKNKKIASNVNGPLCYYCYYKLKAEKDVGFNIVMKLRTRIRAAFLLYTKTGKKKTSKEYGIDFERIISKLGECPGDIKNYHIDHIFPLSAFDLTDDKHVKAAFAPENHQWLFWRDNILKSNKYDKELFSKYLNKHGIYDE